MKKKLNCILLVDDDKSCHFFHKIILNEIECAEKIEEVYNGEEALAFIKSRPNDTDESPAIIFLDINMPRMNGWEFLEEYEKLGEDQKAKSIIVMLTSSINQDDADKAKKYKSVSDFYNKFLDKDIIENILKEHFSEYL